ncbi:MAG: arginine decarboxylase, pyruvoyl-dependent [Phycisphaerales bacterium]|nr:arginine decarboxylase, pyruvoyl-dependent [Phycisphaerales bacterium]
MVPTEMFFTRGVGVHKHSLQSFEVALRQAGIAAYNLVTVSSIFPPKCKIVSRAKGVAKLKPGGIVHCVLAECRTNEPYRLAAAGIGLALPANRDDFGYISEHHGFGLTHKHCGDHVEDMAASMLATTYGLDLDPETAYDKRREIYKSKKLVVKTQATVQTAQGDKNGLWTTVVAAAVFVYD